MFDDCYKDLTALAQSLHFVQDEETDGVCYLDAVDEGRVITACSNDSVKAYDVAGVLGSESSITTIQSANLLTSFKIPLVSMKNAFGRCINGLQ